MVIRRLIKTSFFALVIMVLATALVIAGDTSFASSPLKARLNRPEAKPYAETIAGLLGHLIIKKPQIHDNLAIFPVAWKGNPDSVKYTTLEASSKEKTVEITELKQASVPQLKVNNNSKKLLFLMTGEVLTGAKQDRILAHDILIDPKQKQLLIPVYCVEQGRWKAKSDKFAPAGNVVALKVRRAAAQKADQSEVWKQVGEVNTSLEQAASGSIQESFEDEKSKKERAAYRDSLIKLPKKRSYVGAIVAINGKITNADVFSSPGLFAALWPKLIEAYALEASRERTGNKLQQATIADAQAFLVNAFDAHFRELQNPGLGAEFKIEADNTAGSVLVHDGHAIHLALFPFEAPKGPEKNSAVMPLEHAMEIAPDQIMNNLPVQQVFIPEGSFGSRSSSFKEDGLEFDLKNPEHAKIKTRP